MKVKILLVFLIAHPGGTTMFDVTSMSKTKARMSSTGKPENKIAENLNKKTKTKIELVSHFQIVDMKFIGWEIEKNTFILPPLKIMHWFFKICFFLIIKLSNLWDVWSSTEKISHISREKIFFSFFF